MELLESNKAVISLVEETNKSDRSVRDNYLLAFVSAVNLVIASGNITILTHAIQRVSNKSSYRKRIIAWLEYYAGVKYDPQADSFKYIVKEGKKIKISSDSLSRLVENPFWDKLPTEEPEFQFFKKLESIEKRLNSLFEDAVNNGYLLPDNTEEVIKMLEGIAKNTKEEVEGE